MEKIKVVVVDDVKDIRDYIKSALEKENDITVIGEASRGDQAVEVVRKLKPDVVLMDILMETPTAGLEATEIINSEYQEIRLIILTIHEDSHVMFRAYCSGAMDYIIKTSPAPDIVQAVRNAYNNEMMIRPNVAAKLVDEFTQMRTQQESLLFTYNIISKLSNSELDVLLLIFDGYKYREIAGMRYVSVVTVKSQVNSILRKFGYSNMKEVIAHLYKMNFKQLVKNIRADLN